MKHEPTELPLFAWQPSSKIIPFPVARRHNPIAKTARNAARFKDETAARMLNRAADDYLERMCSFGVDRIAAEEQAAAYRAALFASLRRFQVTGGAA